MSSTGKGMSERAFVDSVTQGFHVYASGSRETAKVAFGSGGAADAALSAVTQMMLAMNHGYPEVARERLEMYFAAMERIGK